MNKQFLPLFLILSFAIAKADNPVVIKTVEGRRIVSDSAEGKAIEAKLTETRNKLEKEIRSIDSQIEADIKNLQARARTVDQEILEKDQQKIVDKKQERDLKAQRAEETFKKEFNKELAKFNGKIRETVAEQAKAKGWDIVNIKETGEIIYTSPKVDATNEIIQAHDSKYKAQKAQAAVDQAKKPNK